MSQNKNNKVILITGGSSGIGFESAKSLVAQGYTVYAAARRVDKMSPLADLGVKILQMDVTNLESMQLGVETVLREQGRIDVLVNNAGFGYLGAIEAVDIAEARRQIEVNVFGLAQLCQLVMPAMRKQHSGRIINVSSVAGKAVIAFGGWYNVSKFAVEALSDALRLEAQPFGVEVVLIEPSAIKTDWGLIAADNLEASSAGTAYEKSAAKMARFMRFTYQGNFISGPDAVRRSICKAVNARRPRLRYRPGLGALFLIYSHAILPGRWWDSLNRSILT